MKDTLNYVIQVILIPCIPAVSAYLIALIKKQTEKVKAETHNAELNKYIDIAKNAIITATGSVTQTYVDSLKKSGSFDSQAQITALGMAKDKAISIMGYATKEALKEVYGDVDKFLTDSIEHYIGANK